MTTIHPTAIVHPDAVIADNVEIGQYVIIEANVEIGEGTRIESGNRICSGARIGRNCTIMHGAAIATPPQDPAYRDEPTLAIIGDNTSIREFVTVNRGSATTGKTVIGSHCMIMAYCHIAHDCAIGDSVVIANGVQTGAGASIFDFAIIGGMTGIVEQARIGREWMGSGAGFGTQGGAPVFPPGRGPDLC
jgi:UDP-N-acetylglucosamine acyltransferase